MPAVRTQDIMTMIKIAAIAPHAPILLPDTGTPADHARVSDTLRALDALGKEFSGRNLDEIIISSPHEDWGFKVPLHFLAPDFSGKIAPHLTGPEPPAEHYEAGREAGAGLDPGRAYGLIASGDLSHVLKEEGPYGFNPQGPRFDAELLELLEEKDTEAILGLDDKYPEAADCGLRSFAFCLGALAGAGVDMEPEIMSYEGPFGVGYLVARLA